MPGRWIIRPWYFLWRIPTPLKVSLHVKDPKFWEEFQRVKQAGGVFYFWGHSYEIKTEADWQDFEDKVAKLSADPAVKWVTNLELFESPQGGLSPATEL